MNKSFLICSLIMLVIASCDLPPHHAKKKDLEKIPEDTLASEAEIKSEELSRLPEFDKLDMNILMDIFHGDSLDLKNKSVYWIPFVEEQMEKANDVSICKTNIEDVFYFDNEKNKWAFVLFVTYDEIALSEYHSSAPIIGGACFMKNKNGKWELREIDKSITRHGEHGVLKPYRFVRYGKSDYALQLMFSYTATGETIEQDFFYDLKEIKQIFAFHSGDSNAGIHPEGDPEHYSFESTFSFRPVLKKHYDLIVKMKGTNYDYDKNLKYSVDTTIVYEFNDLRRVYEPVFPSAGINEQ